MQQSPLDFKSRGYQVDAIDDSAELVVNAY